MEPSSVRSTTEIRQPLFSPPIVFEYDVVTSSRRPAYSSEPAPDLAPASAEEVMPWGHQRLLSSSSSSHRNPQLAALPVSNAGNVLRLRSASTPWRPTRP